MSETVRLKYHDWLFRLLGHEPRVSADAVRTIKRWEAESRIKLPAALREWYALEGIEDALAVILPEHRIVPLPRLLETFASSIARQDRRRPRVLLFGKRPGTTGWPIYLYPDGTDDPPFILAIYEEALPFSEGLADVAWSALTTDRPNLVAGAITDLDPPAEFGPAQFDFLGEAFPQMRRGSADPPTFRFSRPGAWVEVEPEGDPSHAPWPAVYSLWADTEEQLLGLYESLWPCHGVPVRLYPVDLEGYESSLTRLLDRRPCRFSHMEVITRKNRGATW
jgi:hypothetical protein